MAERARRLWLVALLALAGTQPVAAQQRYVLDQHFGSIGFSVGHLGLFSSAGEFRRFHAQLVLDPTRPERTQIAVDVQAGSVAMAWQQATDMLRSADFLDVRHHPELRFNSTSVTRSSPDHYVIRGVLRLRGIARPLVLAARLVRRRADPARHTDTADFVVTGSLERSDFGMTADPGFISDRVDLRITARVEIAGQSGAG